MKMRWLGRITAILVSLSPAATWAGNPTAPHDGSFTDGDCSNCHALYIRTATGALDYSSACMACHNSPATAGSLRKFPKDEATPGVAGTSHSWSGYADNPAVGAEVPGAYAHQQRLVDGRLQCVVCHSLHDDANPAMNPDSRHEKVVPYLDAPSTLSLARGAGVAKPRGYRIRVQSRAGSTGTFIFTKKAATTNAVWMNYVGGQWVQGTETGPGRSFTVGSPAVVEDGDDLRLVWSALVDADIGKKWDVLVSYPGLRMSLVNDYMCVSCHKSMGQSSRQVAGSDPLFVPDGSRMFSHPVGEGLGANGLGTDRTEALGVDGKPQSQSTDGNSSNRLNMYGGVVRCRTCHSVHAGDSNSLSVD